MILYRYDSKFCNNYTLKQSHYYVPLPIGTDVDVNYINNKGESGLFCTPNLERDSDRAGNFLSLTYYPVFVNEIDTDCLDNVELRTHKYNKLSPVSRYEEIPRVWPAFNKPGGYREVVITNPDSIESHCVRLKGILCNIKPPDDFHQDNTQNYNLKMVFVLYKAIRRTLEDLPNRGEFENLLFRISDNDNGFSVLLPLPNYNRRTTLSAAYRTNDCFTEIRLWCALYEDSENERLRRILGPFSTTLRICLSKSSLQSDDGDLGGNLEYVIEMLKRLLKTSLNIDNKTFYSTAISYELPQ